MVHIHTKIEGNHPVIHLRVPICVYSVTQPMWPFRHLSCTDSDHFWNKRRELVSACVQWWKISAFLCRGFPGHKNS